MMEDAKYLEVLKKYWGYDSFRGIQLNIIKSIDAGRDTLGLMPTGGGKSIAFQVPSLVKPGLCLVVTPLIALMKDQVANLRSRQIRAAAIYSGMSQNQIVEALENCIYGDYKFLYISPERLKSDIFLKKLKHINVNFITVDEAHCISQWGYDFRPSYLSVAEIREYLPGVPILALTATARLRVVDDIQDQLQFKEKNVFRMSFKRSNLAYVVRTTKNKEEELLHILNNTQGSTIVYVRSRRQTREIAEHLNECGIAALYYHAGLNTVDKDVRQNAWQTDETRVMVATNAFGMGIDKSNVHLVVHLMLPDSVEAYFQEAGRAGRDGKKAFAVLLYDPSDATKLKQRISTNYPEQDSIRRIYDSLCYFYQIALGAGLGALLEFDINKFCVNYKLFPTRVEGALHILTNVGVIEYRASDDTISRVLFLITKEELYRISAITGNAELVIRQLLRDYGGVFSDYIPINEKKMALQLQLSETEIYEILKGLSRQRFIHYIPRKKVSHIILKCNRVMGEDILFPHEVYDDRKNEFEKRITDVIHYAEAEDSCRSEMLLSYFGEEKSGKCGVCDYCLKHKGESTRLDDHDAIVQFIKTLASDGKRHLIEECRCHDFDQKHLSEVIDDFVQNEIIQVDGDEFWIE